MLQRDGVEMVICANVFSCCKCRLTRVFAAALLLLCSPLHAAASVLWGG